MATEQQLKDALKKAIESNDTAMADEFAKRLQSGQFDKEQPQQPEPSLGQQALGAVENIAGAALSAPAAIVSGVAGAVSAPFVGMADAGGIVNKVQEGIQSILPPYSETGKQQQRALGEILAPIGEFISQKPGDFAFDLAQNPAFKAFARTNPILQTLARDPAAMGAVGATAIPAALELMGVKSIGKLKTAADARKLIAKEIADGNPNINNITQTLDASGNLIKNPNLKRAVKLLGDDIEAKHAAILVEQMSPATKKQFNRMLDIVEQQRQKGAVYGMENRVTNVIGESLARRIQDANKVRQAANKQLDAALKKIGSQPVEVTQPLNNFVNQLRQVGIDFDVDDAGRISSNLDNATATLGDVLPKTELDKVVNMLASGSVPAEQAHRLKRFVRQFVDYGEGLNVGARQSAEVANAIKTLSNDLGQSVAALSDDYAKANARYSTVVDSLSMAQRQLKGLNIDDDLATAKLGTLSRRIGSNLQSKEQVLQLVDGLDEALKKNGINYKDDIKQQVASVDLLDKAFKTSANESPFGFQNQIRMAANAKTGNAAGLLSEGINAIKQMREPSFEDKMKTLRAMARETK